MITESRYTQTGAQIQRKEESRTVVEEDVVINAQIGAKSLTASQTSTNRTPSVLGKPEQQAGRVVGTMSMNGAPKC